MTHWGGVELVIRCAVEEPSQSSFASIENLFAHLEQHSPLRSSALEQNSTVIVPVHFHVMTSVAGQGDVPVSTLFDQVAVMNQYFAQQGFFFSLESVDRTSNDDLFHMYPGSLQENLAKDRLAIRDPRHLNVYTIAMGNGGTLGWSTFPWDLQYAPDYRDGIVLAYTTLPHGSAESYNEGKTLIHESGHWLGLWHTFQGGCGEKGDGIYDTPSERLPSRSCTPRDSCPNQPGMDPVENFMDYSPDTCLTQFTPRQRLRMHNSWRYYRDVN
eukprot:gene9806-10845_t